MTELGLVEQLTEGLFNEYSLAVVVVPGWQEFERRLCSTLYELSARDEVSEKAFFVLQGLVQEATLAMWMQAAPPASEALGVNLEN
jgi:hypothetical protein